MRTFDKAVRERTWTALQYIASETDSIYGTTTEVDINHGYPTVVNNIGLADLARSVAAGVCEVVELEKRYTAEDFGFYTEQYPSLFYRLGVGASAGRSHSATFAPDERAIDFGVEMMTKIAQTIK